MKEFTIKASVWLVVILTAATFGIKFLKERILHINFFEGYYALAFVFFLAGVVTLVLINIVDIKNDRRIAQTFLIIKFIKNLIIIISAFIYIVDLHITVKNFLLIAGMFYIIYLTFESVLLVKFEKLIKKLNEKVPE